MLCRTLLNVAITETPPLRFSTSISNLFVHLHLKILFHLSYFQLHHSPSFFKIIFTEHCSLCINISSLNYVICRDWIRLHSISFSPILSNWSWILWSITMMIIYIFDQFANIFVAAVRWWNCALFNNTIWISHSFISKHPLQMKVNCSKLFQCNRP